MSIYKISTPVVDVDGHPVVHQGFAGSNKMARGMKKEMAEQYEVKASEMTVEEVTVNKGKTGLIEFLNASCAQIPGNYEPEEVEAVARKPRKKKPVAKKSAAKKK